MSNVFNLADYKVNRKAAENSIEEFWRLEYELAAIADKLEIAIQDLVSRLNHFDSCTQERVYEIITAQNLILSSQETNNRHPAEIISLRP